MDLTPHQHEVMQRMADSMDRQRAQTLWAMLAFAGLIIVVVGAVLGFVFYFYGLTNATWFLVLVGMVGFAALVSSWNDRVQERALRMMTTYMHTAAQQGTLQMGIDPSELRRQNAITQGVQHRLELKQTTPATGFIFDDDDAEIIEVKS